MSSLEGGNLVAFYYLNASQIWPDEMYGLCWEWPVKKGATGLNIYKFINCEQNATFSRCQFYCDHWFYLFFIKPVRIHSQKLQHVADLDK